MPRPMPGAWVRVAPRLQASLEILDIFSLRPHEQVQKALLEKTMREIVEEGRLRLPALVEREHRVILDGHHRYEALRRLGRPRGPRYVGGFASGGVPLPPWAGGGGG